MKLLPLFIALASLVPAQETFSGSAALDAQMQQAVGNGLIPGGVLLVGHDGKIVHRKAYGQRALVPARETMTLDTIFDLASLTKVVATTPAIMKLFEQGKIRLIDPVTVYLPEFQGGKSDITVRDLLTHFSGLRPDLDLDPAWSGYETGIRKALIDKPTYPPGERFIYSDINFELLGEIVRRVSGETLDKFVREQVYEPLGMHDTMYLPPASLRPRIAPTEVDAATGKPWRGVVHDPTARYMGGVAGHAGVFSTASDLARYCEMLLGMGERARRAHLCSRDGRESSPKPRRRPINRCCAALAGISIRPIPRRAASCFPSAPMAISATPARRSGSTLPARRYVILLTNYVHPKSGKNLSPLRRSISTIAAAALGLGSAGVNETGYNEALESSGARRMIAPNHRVLTGLDVLEEQKFAPLQGKRVGLITNQTGLDRSGRTQHRCAARGRRQLDRAVRAGARHHRQRGPSRYRRCQGCRNRPADLQPLRQRAGTASLPKCCAASIRLVFDIQDAGARFYTYSCTMLYALDQAAKSRLPFYVLDRPNPVTGVHVEGPLLDAGLESFVGCYALPVRHGLTLGELATMANAEKKLGADLHVIKMKDWSRGDWFDSTGPHLDRSFAQPAQPERGHAVSGRGDAGIVAESFRRAGTDAPFEQIGADWIHGTELAQALDTRSHSRRASLRHAFPAHGLGFQGQNHRRSALRHCESRNVQRGSPRARAGVRAAAAVSGQARSRSLPPLHRQSQE